VATKKRSSSDKDLKAGVKELRSRAERAEARADRWKVKADRWKARASRSEKDAVQLRKELKKVTKRLAKAHQPEPESRLRSVQPRREQPDSTWTVVRLRGEARSRGLSAVSGKTKAELIELLTTG
jgi:hypothetical protein